MSDILWKVSGHWEHYKDNIFLTSYDEAVLCQTDELPRRHPGFQQQGEELPGTPDEDVGARRGPPGELSGVLSGLFRVIQFTQDDAHIYCMEEQLESEINAIINLVDKFYKLFGFEYRMELSTKPENSMGDPLIMGEGGKHPEESPGWQERQVRDQCRGRVLRTEDRLQDQGLVEPGVADRHHTAGLPDAGEIPDQVCRRRWKDAPADHAAPDRLRLAGTVHWHPAGAPERQPAGLAGTGPGPGHLVQGGNAKAAEAVYQRLFDLGYRVKLDLSAGTVEGKIRDAEMQKIPYIIVMGDKEEQSNTLAIRRHGAKGAKFGVKLDDFEKQLNEECRLKQFS